MHVKLSPMKIEKHACVTKSHISKPSRLNHRDIKFPLHHGVVENSQILNATLLQQMSLGSLQFSNLVFCCSTMPILSRLVWFLCLVLFILVTSNSLWFQPNRTAFALLGNETDHSALLKFKESINNDPFQVLKSWNGSSHFCNWHGVTCNPQHQRVTELNLTGYRLQGFISPHTGNLTFLRLLSLEANNFYGEIPPELGRLSQLQTLILNNNTLTGELPISLTNCSELRDFDAGSNNFSGKIPPEIGHLGKLERLMIRSNNLIGQIPASIGNLSSLTFLSMSYNNLEGNIPEEIGHLKSLTTIFVPTNKLSGMLPSSLYNLSSLTRISITYNQFNGSLPTNMFLNLRNIKLVAIAANQFSGPIPTSITNASGIQLLDIGDNNFAGKVPSLGKLQNLSFLNLGSYNLGSNSPNDLGFLKSLINCTQLNIMDITNNHFQGPLPNLIGNFSTQLTELYLGGNQISGRIPTELGNLFNLVLLTMETNHLAGIIPATFGKLRKLQVLNLARNKLSGVIPAFIGNLSQLVSLNVSHNMFIGSIPSTIGNCKNLEFLELSHNNFSGALPSQIFGLPSLSILLDVSHNSLNGSLPIEVGMLKMIDKLDVSENSLSGAIPTTIGECLSLEYLFIQGNSFDGTITPSLASLKGLRMLDLSRNKLSGSIPEGIQQMSVLEYFNASFNMLEGEVPTNGVFRNSSAVFLTHNGELCGGILELKFPPCPLKDIAKRKHHNHKRTVLIICLVVFCLLFSCILTIYLMRKRTRKTSVDSTIVQLLPTVSYQNLYRATNGFSSQNLIGTGSIGSVYKGSIESEGKVVAIKVLNLQMKGAHKSFISECNALKDIRHRNLVKIFTCCSSVDYNGNDFKAFIFEFMPNGSLEDWLHPVKEIEDQSRKLNIKGRLEIIIGVASALHYLHYECEQPIIHCDLKPSNILLDDDMVAHVSDFGLARLISTINDNSVSQTSTTGMRGTIGYAPPEYGINSQVSILGDVYSFGILLLEMLIGKRPTDELFKDDHNLHNYVQNAFPNNILEIIDASLFSLEYESPPRTIEGEYKLAENAFHLHPIAEKCLFSLVRIGLACSVELPKERINMIEVTRELALIRNSFSF